MFDVVDEALELALGTGRRRGGGLRASAPRRGASRSTGSEVEELTAARRKGVGRARLPAAAPSGYAYSSDTSPPALAEIVRRGPWSMPR